MERTVQSDLEAKRAKGLALKALHDAELITTGDGFVRPRSVGQKYDIPPIDGTYCEDKVDQTGADSVNLNNVMKRFEKTGKLTELIALGAQGASGMRYGDFTAVPDFQSALNISIHAKEQFALLDAKVRNRFDNDPTKFLEFVGDARNLDEMEAMGLLSPDAVETRRKAREAAGNKGVGAEPTPPASQPPAGA